MYKKSKNLVDISDIFIFLFGGGEGGVRGAVGGGGVDFLLKIPGVSPRQVGAGEEGAGRVFAGILGGGTIFFIAEIPTEKRANWSAANGGLNSRPKGCFWRVRFLRCPLAGKKKIYTTTVETLLFFFPPFSGSEALWCIPFFPDLWCVPFSLVFPQKLVYTGAFAL